MQTSVLHHLDSSVLHHLDSSVHIKIHSLLTNSRNDEKAALDKGKECCINCAAVACITLYFSEVLNTTLLIFIHVVDLLVQKIREDSLIFFYPIYTVS